MRKRSFFKSYHHIIIMNTKLQLLTTESIIEQSGLNPNTGYAKTLNVIRSHLISKKGKDTTLQDLLDEMVYCMTTEDFPRQLNKSFRYAIKKIRDMIKKDNFKRSIG